MRTVPVNQSSGPFAEGCVPALFISMLLIFVVYYIQKLVNEGHQAASKVVTIHDHATQIWEICFV